MKKKILFLVVALAVSVASHAQFEEGKLYAGASLSGVNLSYSGSTEGSLNVTAKGGYLLLDNLMLTGQVGVTTEKNIDTSIMLGVGGRYYIVQNGLFLGAGLNYYHADKFNDFRPTVQVGYAFFITQNVTVEPEIYYEQSFRNHKDYSTLGVRIGFGIYL